MELIQPAEISGKIMTIFDQAKEKIIIVSPYNKIKNWRKLTNRIEKAKQRGVEIIWYTRKNVDYENVDQIRQLGINPIQVENLHCKLYLNEQHAVVTSMNLHEFSDSSSIDIGYYVTKKEKYNELVDFIKVHIDNNLGNKKQEPEIKTIKKSIFDKLLLTFLADNGFNRESLKTRYNGYGTVINVHGFIGNFELVLEPKPGYYRIDLRINFPYKIKNEIYSYLESREDELNKLIGAEISFGSQMKRLKIDLEIFKNYEYSQWDTSEFEILRPILENTIKVYKKYINNAILARKT